MKIQQLLSKTPGQLKTYCESLGDKDKQDLYKRAIDEAKGKTLKELKQLSTLATAIEKTMDKNLLEPFYNSDNPFNKTAVLEFIGKLCRRLILITNPFSDKDLRQLEELDKLLPDMYEKLKLRLTNHMKSYVEKELKSNNFLRENISTFVLLKRAEIGSEEERKRAMNKLVDVFMFQPVLNYKVDVFILFIILKNIKGFWGEMEIEPELSSLVILLSEDANKLECLEDKIEMIEEEGKVSAAECRKEMEEVEEKLKDTREKIKEKLSWLKSFTYNFNCLPPFIYD